MRDLAVYTFCSVAVLVAVVNVIALAMDITAHVWGVK